VADIEATQVTPDPVPSTTATFPRTLPRIDERNRIPWLAAGALAAVAVATVAAIALAGGGGGAPPSQATHASHSPPSTVTATTTTAVTTTTEATGAAPAAPAPPPSGGAPTSGAALGKRLNDQGYGLIQSGDYAAAVPVLRRAVASFPKGTGDINYAYALFNLGHALRMAGDPAAAIPVLEQRLAIPDQTDVVQRELDAARAAASPGAPGLERKPGGVPPGQRKKEKPPKEGD
jgi:serine/threonine-protein kinase